MSEDRVRAPKNPPKPKKDRLAAALRANIARRKRQAKVRGAEAPAAAPRG